MKPKIMIRNAWGFEPLDSDYEHPKGEDMCIPDDSFTISEILSKYSHGITPNIHLEGDYTDTEDFEDYDRFSDPDFDLTDLADIKARAEATIKEAGKQAGVNDDEEGTTEEAEADKKPDDLAELKP